MKKFPWRFAVYGLAVLYLAGDLYVFRGPLKRRIEVMRGNTPDAAELARQENIIATANGFPIRREELALAVSEDCLRRGIEEPALPRKRLNEIRVLVFNELLVDRLLWFHAQAAPVEVPDAAFQAVRDELAARFDSNEAMEAKARARGFAPGQLEKFLKSYALQQTWVEAKIAPHIAVSEDELRARYAELGGGAGETFEELRDELAATLEAEKRIWAIDGLIDHLKRKAVIRVVREDFWVE